MVERYAFLKVPQERRNDAPGKPGLLERERCGAYRPDPLQDRNQRLFTRKKRLARFR